MSCLQFVCLTSNLGRLRIAEWKTAVWMPSSPTEPAQRQNRYRWTSLVHNSAPTDFLMYTLIWIVCLLLSQDLTEALLFQAAVHGVRLNNQELRLAWHKPPVSLSAADTEAVEPEEEEVSFSPTAHSVSSVQQIV